MPVPGFTAGMLVDDPTRGLGVTRHYAGPRAPRPGEAMVRAASGYTYGQCAGPGEMSCELDDSGHGICVGEGWAPVVLPDGGFSEAWCGV